MSPYPVAKPDTGYAHDWSGVEHMLSIRATDQRRDVQHRIARGVA